LLNFDALLYNSFLKNLIGEQLMNTVLGGVLVTTYHGLGASIYNIFSLSTKGDMGKWTRWQWGGLVGTTALSVFRPTIQKRLDERLGKTKSRYFFDLTPFIVMGFTQWKANRLLKPSLCAGAYFACVHKVINWQQHAMAWDRVWSGRFLPEQRAEPQTYYEALALEQGRAEKAKQKMDWVRKDGGLIQSLCLIQTGEVERGTALFGERREKYGITFLPEKLLDAQISYHIRRHEFEAACACIQTTERSITGSHYWDRFSCYEVMLQAYGKMKKTDELLALLRQMEQELPEIERKETDPLRDRYTRSDYDYKHRLMVAKGYCYLEDQDDKIVQLMNVQMTHNIHYTTNMRTLFDTYIKQKFGTDQFDPMLTEKLECSLGRKESIVEAFNVRVALRYIESAEYGQAAPFAHKVHREEPLKALVEAYIKKGQLGQAELCAKKMNGRGIYQTIGQAYLEAGNFDKALEMAGEARDQSFIASVYLAFRTIGDPYEEPLRAQLKDGSTSLVMKARIICALGEDLSAIEASPTSSEKVLAYLALANDTKDDRYLGKAKEVAEGASGEDGWSYLPVARSLLEKNQVEAAFTLIKKAPRIFYPMLFETYQSMEGLDPYDHFQGLDTLEAYQRRVDLANSLQKEGKYAEALGFLEPIFQQ
jgi:pentatricopeptide repeat protein